MNKTVKLFGLLMFSSSSKPGVIFMTCLLCGIGVVGRRGSSFLWLFYWCYKCRILVGFEEVWANACKFWVRNWIIHFQYWFTLLAGCWNICLWFGISRVGGLGWVGNDGFLIFQYWFTLLAGCYNTCFWLGIRRVSGLNWVRNHGFLMGRSIYISFHSSRGGNM